MKVDELVKSSPNSMLVDNANATKSGDEATKAFKPSGKPMPLALRLTGKFKTAFPEGPVKDGGQAASPNTPQLRESADDNSVILVADVDLLADGAAVDVQEVFGRKIVVPSNGNLAFAHGHGRAVRRRRRLHLAAQPHRRVPAAHGGARAGGRSAEAVLRQDPGARGRGAEDHRQAAGAAEGARRAGKSAQLLTPEQQAEMERFRKTVAEARLALKEVRKNLRQDAESLVFWTKVANIALMPLLVALIGLLVAFFASRRRRAV